MWSGQSAGGLILGLEAGILTQLHYKTVPVISRNSSRVVIGCIFGNGSRQSIYCGVFRQM